MINLMEAAALAAVEHLLPAGHQSLGIHLDVRHFAATPVGLHVVAAAEVTGVEGRTITFRVEARDERETIGEGHPRPRGGQRRALRCARAAQAGQCRLIAAGLFLLGLQLGIVLRRTLEGRAPADAFDVGGEFGPLGNELEHCAQRGAPLVTRRR